MHTPATWIPRPLPAFVALCCAFVGAYIAWHYPLAHSIMLAAFAAFSGATFLRPGTWLFALPAALPVIGLASWTGWIAFEEFDIFVLAAAAGGYAALAVAQRRTSKTDQYTAASSSTDGSLDIGSGAVASRTEQSVRLSGFAWTWVTLFALSMLVALYRGIAGAATAEFGWFGGYDDAVNSLRIAKSFFLILLLYPLLRAELQRSSRRALELLASGLATGLGLGSIAVVWERVAFPGVLNFSTDYRATALFWEMHVGGAALDGFLALTAPFVVWQFLRSRTLSRLALAGGIVLVAGYACLATFSRGVYLALPVSMGLLTLLLLMQRQSLSIASAGVALAKGCLSALAIATAAWLIFRTGGYRSLIAVLAVMALMLPLAAATRRVSAGQWFAAIALGGVAGAMGGLVAQWIPKGNYVIFLVAFAVCAGLLWQRRRFVAGLAPFAAVTAYVWVMVAAALVASGWGGTRALYDTSTVLLLMLAITIWNSRLPRSLRSDNVRTQCGLVVAAALMAITVAVFGGGAYMGDRFVSSERDLGGRLQHWRDGIGMLNTTADWLVGKGLGRFPQNYYFNARDRDFPGAYRIDARDEKPFLALFGPRRDAGFGEMLRVSQRVTVVPGGRYTVVLDARAPEAAELHVEICEKHLLYDEGCAIGKVMIDATAGVAQRKVVSLDGKNLSASAWYAPRLAFFSMAVESPGRRVEIDDVSLLGQDGGELLVNGDFREEMRRWFFTSDRLHLPWHIKNVGLAVLFDQGLLGVLSLGLLVGTALARLIAGRARGHPAAPYLAAALAGFLVVGAFDSLLDVPRLGFLFYLIVLVSLTLTRETRPSNEVGP